LNPAEQQQLSGTAYLRLVGIGALIGIPAALVAALFLALVHELEDWLWPSSPAWYVVIGLPVAGACIVILARRLLPGDGGHAPLEGLGGGPTPVAWVPGIALAALGTLAFGAVLGPEAPLIALGSAVGMAATRFVRVDDRAQIVVGTAGSFSAISALFGGPIVAGTMLVESGVEAGARLLPVLLPGFVAAAIGYTIFIGFGDWGGLHQQSLAVPHLPEYNGTHVYDLLLAIAVGIATAVAVTATRRGAQTVAGPGLRRLGMAPLLLAGGLAVGLIAQIADWLGADSQTVLFSGQSGVPDLAAADSTKIVLILLVGKALAYAVSLGCGFRGGPIFPAIFMGIAIAVFPVVWFDVSPTLAVAVGAAAGMAAGTRLLITSTLFASLLVGSPGADAVPAAVLAAAAAWLTMRFVDARAGAQVEAPAEAGASVASR
jgi:H+/Cl- antiporter ClcA